MKKKTCFVQTLDQFRRLEVRKKARNVFALSLRLSDHKPITQSYLYQFFSISLVFRISTFLEFKEFNKTIIPFALVGYETGYSQLGATRLIGYLPSHIQCALME